MDERIVIHAPAPGGYFAELHCLNGYYSAIAKDEGALDEVVNGYLDILRGERDVRFDMEPITCS